MNIIKKYSLAFLLLFLGAALKANNIRVSSVTFNGKDLSAGANNVANTTSIQFNLSWENSWRTNNVGNWDAAWVFAKYRITGGNWRHAWLGNSGHIVPAGFQADAGLLDPAAAHNRNTNPCLGVFIYRSQIGFGNNNLSNVKIQWNHGAQGIPDNAVVDIQVYAIEMVYVPQGSFYVGSGGTENGSFTDGAWTSGATIPFEISSEAALGIDNAQGKLWGTNSDIGNASSDAEATLPASFPKGYAAFYCMKYEISQGQYRDFLNSLTRDQQAFRVSMDGNVGTYAGGFLWNVSSWSATESSDLTSSEHRIGLRMIDDPGGAAPVVFACDLNESFSLPSDVNQSDDGEWIAMGQLNWSDNCAFLDWAGLRPLTELEYEKACRGRQYPVANEYAWGSAVAIPADDIVNEGANNEGTSTSNANAVYGDRALVFGPLRGGAFATSSTNREQSGASIYGIMEMTGNVYERCVTVGNEAGRSYTGIHGNGLLEADGFADVDFWPGVNGNASASTANTSYGGTTGVIESAGAGFRGGAWIDPVFSISNRGGSTTTNNRRQPDWGGRGVRTAP
jgi:formylglycine-generating enzyme required for sulfatase activity